MRRLRVRTFFFSSGEWGMDSRIRIVGGRIHPHASTGTWNPLRAQAHRHKWESGKHVSRIPLSSDSAGSTEPVRDGLPPWRAGDRTRRGYAGAPDRQIVGV